jgi:hypothetical protein
VLGNVTDRSSRFHEVVELSWVVPGIRRAAIAHAAAAGEQN